MNVLRKRIVEDFEKMTGRHEDPDIYGGPDGDPGLIGPDSVSWRVNADLAAVAQAGTAAIVLEILHPSVVAGVQDMSSYREDPFKRARATLGYVLATTFGNTAAATRIIEHVKHIHSFVNGTRPDGVAYRALDPDLIAWVHTAIPWMILRTYDRTNRRLSTAEKDAYLAEQAIIGRMGGAEWVPTNTAELDEYVATMRPEAGGQHPDPGVHRLPAVRAVRTQPAAGSRCRAASLRALRGDERRTELGTRADRVRPAFAGGARHDQSIPSP